MDTYEILLTGYIFILGTIFGSFFNVVGIRIPEKDSLLGRSHCPKCGRTLGWIELIPILGYIILRGKCKNCSSKISVKYPIMEFITGALFSVSFVILGQTMVEYILEYILVVIFISMMVIITVSDLYYNIVPDKILIIFLPLLIVFRILSPVIPWWDSIIAGILGFGFMYLIAWYGRIRFKQEALGGGDIKLYMLIGIFLGIDLVFMSVLFAAIFALGYGLIKGKKSGYVPFVPFIFAGSMTAYYIGPIILDWYINLLF